MVRKPKMEWYQKTLFRRKSIETSGILQTRLHHRQINVREIMAVSYTHLDVYKRQPILFVSALTKQRILRTVEVAMEVYANRAKKIKTSKLNEIMLPIFEKTPPPALKGKYVKIKYCVQLPTPSPQFVFFCNLPQYVKEAYKRFTENQLRKEFGFTGVPIEVYFRQK